MIEGFVLEGFPVLTGCTGRLSFVLAAFMHHVILFRTDAIRKNAYGRAETRRDAVAENSISCDD